jgi:hypothetical protein
VIGAHCSNKRDCWVTLTIPFALVFGIPFAIKTGLQLLLFLLASIDLRKGGNYLPILMENN